MSHGRRSETAADDEGSTGVTDSKADEDAKTTDPAIRRTLQSQRSMIDQ